MKIAVIGAGYVGAVTAACLADVGNHVSVWEQDKERRERWRRENSAIYEPGLAEVIHRNQLADRLRFVDAPGEAISGAELTFICVGTPQGATGEADIGAVLSAARLVAQHLPEAGVVVIKSTCPPGTQREVRAVIDHELGDRMVHYGLATNPEFLKEGSALHDFTHPDRVVIGTIDEISRALLERLYAPFTRSGAPVLVMDPASAELTKYAANAMLATRISFMNEIATVCDAVGADVREVQRGIGTDARIGPAFLHAGIGYGGSCFPKDVEALIACAEEFDVDPALLYEVKNRNEIQRSMPMWRLRRYFGTLEGKLIAIWGLAFKPNTDDVREAPGVVLAQQLAKRSVSVRAHDPIAISTAETDLKGSGVTFYSDPYSAAVGAHALVLCTEWNEYRTPDWAHLARVMAPHPVIFDGRNLWGPEQLPHAFTYFGVGRGRAA